MITNMINFNKYLRQCEPQKQEKAKHGRSQSVYRLSKAWNYPTT